MTASTLPRREENRSSLVACAVFSAISLALPTALWLLMVTGTSTRIGAPPNVIAIVAAAVLGIAYAAIALAARDSGASLIAGMSVSLGVLGLLALIPIGLLAWLDQMSGGHSMGAIVFGAFVYVAVQFGIASAARALAGPGTKMSARGGFQLGTTLPVICALFLAPMASHQARAETDRVIAGVKLREKTRSDLFALYACATTHRARAPLHDYPASLAALGAGGDKCLPAAIASGQGGFKFEYTPRMSGDTVAGFTVRALPREVDPNATLLTMDEHAIIREDYVNTAYPPISHQRSPGLDMLVAMRDCEQLYRRYRHDAPSDLKSLRTFGDSTLNSANPTGCWGYRMVRDGDWFEYGQGRKLNEWTGATYALTFHPRNDSGAVAYEVRPKTWGVTGIWSYLELSPGATYGTPEPRPATTADAMIPVCEFGGPPAGSPQCIPGNSPPPNATLVVDSVPDALGFNVSLVGAVDSGVVSTADTMAQRPSGTTAPEFQYAFTCDGMENNTFVNDPSYTCHPFWRADSVQVRARIRNRDLTMREYTRWVHPKRRPLALRLVAPKSVVLGEALDLKPIAVGRDSSERFELKVHIGDAFPMSSSDWLNGTTVKCTATTRPLSWECSYPDKPGTYPVTVTAKSWKGDSVSASARVVVRRPK